MMEKKRVREKDFDIDGFLNVLEPFYKGGDYDFLLNSDKEIDLTHKRFIVFELDNISSNKVLLPVVTLIIMETFISKMRRLKGIRKVILLEEAWKSLMSPNMAAYILYLFKTVRKYFGEAVVVTQEVDDIISSPIVKEAIINNSDCKILLDQRKYLNKFERIQTLLGLTDKECSQILSINAPTIPHAGTRRSGSDWEACSRPSMPRRPPRPSTLPTRRRRARSWKWNGWRQRPAAWNRPYGYWPPKRTAARDNLCKTFKRTIQ